MPPDARRICLTGATLPIPRLCRGNAKRRRCLHTGCGSAWCCSPESRGSDRCERVKGRDTKGCVVAHVACHDGEVIDKRGGGHQRVLNQVVVSAMLQSPPLTEGLGGHRQD